jgi:hypothetical protein
MTTAFEARLAPGVEFEREVLRMLGDSPAILAVAANGTEHTHPDFVAQLRRVNSLVAKFVRYAPDGVMLTQDQEVIHFDAKAAKSIEKDAYEVYMAYRSVGCRVVLFVRYAGRAYWQDIERVGLIDGHTTVASFCEERRFPVDDAGWITPRNKPRFRATTSMSGTPYREIDFATMVPLEL